MNMVLSPKCFEKTIAAFSMSKIKVLSQSVTRSGQLETTTTNDMRATAHVRAHPRHFYSCSFGFMFQGLATGGEVDVELGPDPRLIKSQTTKNDRNNQKYQQHFQHCLSAEICSANSLEGGVQCEQTKGRASGTIPSPLHRGFFRCSLPKQCASLGVIF